MAGGGGKTSVQGLFKNGGKGVHFIPKRVQGLYCIKGGGGVVHAKRVQGFCCNKWRGGGRVVAIIILYRSQGLKGEYKV